MEIGNNVPEYSTVQPEVQQQNQQAEELQEQSIYASNPISASINLDDYYYDAKDALYLNDFTTATEKIAQDISDKLHIAIRKKMNILKNSKKR